MWGRVVAVIVQGAKWQFKDWPFKVGLAGAPLRGRAGTWERAGRHHVKTSCSRP